MTQSAENYNRPNVSKPVYKFNLKGELVHTYPRTTDAIKGERVSGAKMKDLVTSNITFRGHVFSMSINREASATDTNTEDCDEMPWESNGMFDISGWGKVCL